MWIAEVLVRRVRGALSHPACWIEEAHVAELTGLLARPRRLALRRRNLRAGPVL
jgi:hypothetical protein